MYYNSLYFCEVIRLYTILLTFSLCMLMLACHRNKPLAARAEQTYQQKDSLLWISIIDSPKVNYYEAVTSFEKYWEHRERPTEMDGEAKQIFESRDSQTTNSRSNIDYVYEYKRFLNWQQRNKNLVKPDGSIMTADEIINEWKKRQTDTLTK